MRRDSSSKTGQAGKIQKRALVRLASGAVFQGTVLLPDKTIALVHVKDGHHFSIKVHLRQLRAVRILLWKKVPVGKKEQGCFKFVPHSYRIRLRKTKTLQVVHHLPCLNKIPLVNSDGRTVFFSYYMDYWRQGKWVNAESRAERTEEKTPHRGCVREIIFLD